ncbi:anti-sigma factor [Sphaerisporangium viridialbum]|uniref:anti-sigma factor n=1 Tax=Sphaerisporangium viridialbum TaxID=46189 RepID=UPI003C783980
MRPDPHTLAGAYALDAIDDELERRRFEEHLTGCAECAEEIATLVETAARLGQAAAVEPPAELRRQVMARIGQVRHLPPAVVAPAPRRRRPAGWRTWSAAVTTVAAVAATVVFGVATVRVQDRLEQAEQANRQVSAVLGAADARLATATTDGGRGTVVVSRSQGRLVFVAAGLAPLPDGRAYQLWQIAPGRIRSAGLLSTDSGGERMAMVTAPAPGATKLGVTIEPVGGSAQPTSPPLLLVDVPAA